MTAILNNIFYQGNPKLGTFLTVCSQNSIKCSFYRFTVGYHGNETTQQHINGVRLFLLTEINQIVKYEQNQCFCVATNFVFLHRIDLNTLLQRDKTKIPNPLEDIHQCLMNKHRTEQVLLLLLLLFRTYIQLKQNICCDALSEQHDRLRNLSVTLLVLKTIASVSSASGIHKNNNRVLFSHVVGRYFV